jgi:hypothetical protein
VKRTINEIPSGDHEMLPTQGALVRLPLRRRHNGQDLLAAPPLLFGHPCGYTTCMLDWGFIVPSLLSLSIGEGWGEENFEPLR